jgi:hypothetical protein
MVEGTEQNRGRGTMDSSRRRRIGRNGKHQKSRRKKQKKKGTILRKMILGDFLETRVCIWCMVYGI